MTCEDSRQENEPGHWELQNAENHFSEVFDRALTQGPRFISRPDARRVVVISSDMFECLIRGQENLVAFFQNSPIAGLNLDLERIQDYPRDIEFGE